MTDYKRKKAVLVLADGTVAEGDGCGPTGTYEGEAVFCTGMVGYPESMTDPSYHNQFLMFTYPLIGNYGVRGYHPGPDGLPSSFESDSVKVAGVIAHELCERPHHWQSEKSVVSWLGESSVPAISGVDTRSLTRRLRESGVMPAVLCVYAQDDVPDTEKLRRSARSLKDPTDSNLVKDVSTPVPIVYNDSARHTVALLDCGVKYGIIRSLVSRGLRVVRLPYNSPYDVVESYRPEGVLISNGPGNPGQVDTIQSTIRSTISNGVPIFGICMGNQLLSLAMGATTSKLPYGHRSQNQPCIETGTPRCYITSQNHGYVVDSDSLEGTGLSMWFENANDGSCEGVISSRDKAFSVQFHPEARPGPRDTDYLFDKFVSLMG